MLITQDLKILKTGLLTEISEGRPPFDYIIALIPSPLTHNQQHYLKILQSGCSPSPGSTVSWTGRTPNSLRWMLNAHIGCQFSKILISTQRKLWPSGVFPIACIHICIWTLFEMQNRLEPNLLINRRSTGKITVHYPDKLQPMKIYRFLTF